MANAQQPGMAQLTVHSPFDEGYLHNNFGQDPMCANTWQPFRFREGRLRDFEFVQPRAQVQQELRVETGADFAGKDEIIPIEVPHEQRAETDAAALRIRESADDKLLRSLALHLQPVRRAAMLAARRTATA